MKFELIEPEDRKGFYEIGELKKIIDEAGVIKVKREDGKIKTFESKQYKLDWEKTLAAFHKWLAER
jgi:hypothetical protein